MRHTLLALMVFSGCAQTPPSPATPSELTEDDCEHFLAAAMFEGLHEDSPDPEIFGTILKDRMQHFINKCPICNPVAGAVSAYVAFKDACWLRHAGRGFPAAIEAGLKSPDRAARLKAIEAMVGRYVARGFERSTMTEAEKAKMKEWITEGKRFGMSVKEEAFGDYCPSCAGATKK